MPGLDQLRVNLEAQRSTRFDVSTFVEEEYVEEIDMATFIQSMLIVPSLESRAATPSNPTLEVILTVEVASTPRAAAVG